MASPDIPNHTKKSLSKQLENLNPFLRRKNVKKKLKQTFSYIKPEYQLLCGNVTCLRSPFGNILLWAIGRNFNYPCKRMKYPAANSGVFLRALYAPRDGEAARGQPNDRRVTKLSTASARGRFRRRLP